MFEFLTKIKAFLGTEKQYVETRIPLLTSGKGFALSQAGSISTVHTCIKILGETLSKLPLEIYDRDEVKGMIKAKDDYRYDILHFNPNSYTTSQAFICALETNRNFKGNSFALIERNQFSGRVEGLYIIDPDLVVDYIIQNNRLYYGLKNKDKEELDIVPSENMLHFRMMTKDGIWGINPIEALRWNLSTTYKGLQTIDSFYDNNANSPKAIKSNVMGANQKSMMEALDKFNKEYTGATQAGKMIPLPPNTEIQELKLNFADAEFIQTIKFNANQIAALYGIPVHMVGNTETSKYNNVEQMGIGFKGDTISPIARMYRQEFEFKLLNPPERKAGKSIEFNLNAMIETDHKTRMEGYKTLSQIGVISPNKIAQIENLETTENGDVRLVPMNMMTLDKLKATEKIQANGKQN